MRQLPKRCADCFVLLPDNVSASYEGAEKKIVEPEVKYCPKCGSKVEDA